MKTFFSIKNLYLLLAFLLMLQDVVYEGGSFFSKFIIFSFVVLSFIYTVYANVYYRLPLYFKGLNALLILFSIYGLWHIGSSHGDYVWSNGGEVASYSYLLSIYLSLLPIYAFYIITIKQQINLPEVQIIGIIFLICSLIKYFNFQADSTDVRGVDEITNNYGYLFASIIPLMTYYKDKPILQYLMLIVCFMMAILSMKRGAILISILCILPFIVAMWKTGNNQVHIYTISFVLISMFIGIHFIQYLLNTSEYFVTRIQATMDGNTSLRDELLRNLWDYYCNKASILTQIFGGGANHTLQVTDNYAHNDWMEILINQGIVGIIVYVIYWINFLKTYLRAKTINELQIESYTLFIIFIASFMMTIFSMSYSNLQICLTMALGFSLGRISLNHLEK